jgi:soluble P-type ATPase
MLTVTIPGSAALKLEHLVLDHNGTLALDGFLLPGAAELLTELSGLLDIRVVTADTFGLAAKVLAHLPVGLTVLGPGGQAEAKLAFCRDLGLEKICAVGNGRNDRLMLKGCALGLAVIGPEGASAATLAEADLVCPDIRSALSLLLNPLRLAAGLRD